MSNVAMLAGQADKRLRTVLVQTAVLFGVWSALGVLGYSRHFLLDVRPPTGVAFWSGMPAFLVCYVAWAPLTPLIFALERRFPLEWPPRARDAAVLAVAGVLLSYAAYLMGAVLARLAVALGGAQVGAGSWRMPLSEFTVEFLFFAAVVVVASALRRFAELETRRREAAQFAAERAHIEAELRKAELESMRIRLNPHFLFNALQNISVLAQEDPQTAARMLTKLGDVLRTAIRPDFQDEIPLRQEIDITCAYLEVEKMRFGDRLEYEVQLQPGTESTLVPSLLLQPLAENAIVHGLAGTARRGKIQIRSRREDGWLMLSVSDNGNGVASGATAPEGIGLTSTRGRLERLYSGEKELFAMVNRPEGGTEVRVRVREQSRLRTASS